MIIESILLLVCTLLTSGSFYFWCQWCRKTEKSSGYMLRGFIVTIAMLLFWNIAFMVALWT